MELIEYNSTLLIDFYIKNGLEFNANKVYFGMEVKSYALVENKKIIGAISFSKYKNVNYIEAISVDTEYRKKGYGKMLLDKVGNELKTPIYIISKNDKYFLDYGFKYVDNDLISNECKMCKKYNINCFPKVMAIF